MNGPLDILLTHAPKGEGHGALDRFITETAMVPV